MISSNKMTYPDVDYGSPQENCDHQELTARYKNKIEVIFTHHRGNLYYTQHKKYLHPQNYLDAWCNECNQGQDETYVFIQIKDDIYEFVDPERKMREIIGEFS